jgi:hypothetical protein
MTNVEKQRIEINVKVKHRKSIRKATKELEVLNNEIERALRLKDLLEESVSD